MNQVKKQSIIAGIAFIIAILFSIIGGLLLMTVFEDVVTIHDLQDSIVLLHIGVLLELIGAVAVIIIGAVLYKYVGMINKPYGNAYLSIRIVEAVVLVYAAVWALLLVDLYLYSDYSAFAELSAFDLSLLVTSIRDSILNTLVPVFFILGGFVLFSSFYQTKMVPRWLSIWGMISLLGIVVNALFGFGAVGSMIFGLPIIINELVLGVWLIVKGLSLETIKKIQ